MIAGTDTAHVDLRSVLWVNPKDGSYGWNYIGAETGKEDITHLGSDKKNFYDSLGYTTVPEAYRAGYRAYRKNGAFAGRESQYNEGVDQRTTAHKNYNWFDDSSNRKKKILLLMIFKIIVLKIKMKKELLSR